jgi:hypothetical protein
MPKQVPNQFTEFEFTTAELYAATRFSDLQLMLIQTLAARDAKQRLSINIDPTNLQSLQEEAALKGSIGAYEYLLALARDTESPNQNSGEILAEIPTQQKGE